MELFTKEELLNIYEHFGGDKAQDVVDFVARNSEEWQKSKEREAKASNEQEKTLSFTTAGTLKNGVYVIYKDDTFEKYSAYLKKEDGMRVGICWEGHTWIVGKDYGNLPWSECPESELEDNREGVMEEWQAILDWDAFGLKDKLIDFWRHIGFADDETMPTAPMVLVQEHLAKHGELNAALRFCGLPEYEVGVIRWFAERCNAYYARIFIGGNGNLNNTNVIYTLRVQAVTPWNI